MPFNRTSDDAATHKRVMALPKKDRAAAWGLVHLSLTWSAQQLTDGWVPKEIVELNAASPTEASRLMKLAQGVGLVLGRAKHPDLGTPGWLLVIDHEDKLLHNRSAEEIALERAQRIGSAKIPFAVRMEVLLRDGDQCRYCAKPVTQHDTVGNRQRHLDHVDPDGPSNPDNLVVACAECNGRKKDRTLEEAGLQLLPTPADQQRAPHYTDSTRRQLVKHGYLPDPLERPTDDAPRIARPVDDAPLRSSDPVTDGMFAAHLTEIRESAGEADAAVLEATGTDPPGAKGDPPWVTRVGTGSSGLARAGSAGDGSVGPARRRAGRRHRRPPPPSRGDR